MRYSVLTVFFILFLITSTAFANNCNLNTNPKTVDKMLLLADAYFSGHIKNCPDKTKNKIAVNYPKAKYWYEKAAELDSGKAKLRLGFLYAEKHFTGIENNLELAEKWFLAAAKQNAGDARFRLGNFYQHYAKPPQYNKALYWLTKAAEDGHRVAQYDLANFYLNGKGDLKPNLEKWFYWIKKSAEQGNLHAQIALSKAYENGENGLTKDIQKSTAWAIKIAKKNKSVIWYRKIADNFYEGRGNLPQNTNTAIYWYKKAASKGDEYSKNKLTKLTNKED